ncbi:MAG: hypothetical protein JRI68_34230 [Deltaproteobacteria bacterium]|nr:hypothetical protein [Deltaproteobacteria bacterium]
MTGDEPNGDGPRAEDSDGHDEVDSGELSAREERRARAQARRADRDEADGAAEASTTAGDRSKRGRGRPRWYEFTSAQNEVFSQLQLLMKITAAAQFIASLTACIALWRPAQLLPTEVGLVLAAIVALPIVVGLWTFRAATHFKRIVDTRGADIDHLMRALGELRKLYLLQVGLFALSLILGIVLYVVGADVQPPGGSIPVLQPGDTMPLR